MKEKLVDHFENTYNPERNQNATRNRRSTVVFLFCMTTLLLTLLLFSLRRSAPTLHDDQINLATLTGNGDSLIEPEERCGEIPDSILTMTRGIDITMLDFLPDSVGNLHKNHGFLRPVIKLTCRQNFTKRVRYGSQLLNLPDQVSSNSYQKSSGLVKTDNFSTTAEKAAHEIQAKLAGEVGLDFKLGMFSASASYEMRLASNASKETLYSETKTLYVKTRIDFERSYPDEHLEPSYAFTLALSKLPSSFSLDPTGYLQLVMDFGTHFLFTARFGGYVQNSTRYSSVSRTSSTTHIGSITADGRYKLIQAHARARLSSQANRDKHSMKSSSTSLFYGGNEPLAYAGKMVEWMESISENPKLIAGRLDSISKLIQDPAKAKAFETATQIYLGKAFVNDLVQTLEIFRNAQSEQIHRSSVSGMITELKTQPLDAFENTTKLEDLRRRAADALTHANKLLENVTGEVKIRVISSVLPSATFLGLRRDASVKVEIGKGGHYLKDFKTEIIYNSNEPHWNQVFHTNMGLKDGTIKFCIEDKGWLIRAAYTTDMGCSKVYSIMEVAEELNGIDTKLKINGPYPGIRLSVNIRWEQWIAIEPNTNATTPTYSKI